MGTNNYTTIAEFCEYEARVNPNEIISSFHDEINVFNSKELNEKANLLAKGFLHQGISKGTCVALVLADTTNCLTFALALAKIGAILIPLKKETELKAVAKILREEKVQSIGFYASSYLRTFTKLVDNIDQNERGYLNSKDFPDLKNIITLGGVKNRGMFTTRELMLLGSHIDDIEVEDALLNVMSEDIFLRSITFGDKHNKSVKNYKHRQILKDNYSFGVFQKFLLEII